MKVVIELLIIDHLTLTISADRWSLESERPTEQGWSPDRVSHSHVLEHGNTPRLLFRFLFYTHWSRWTSFSEEKRNSLSNFQRPAARHLGSQHVTRSSFRLFYLFLSNKVPIVCIMFLSPWVFPLPSATFLVAALRITQFSHLVLCALYSRHHC